MRERGFANFRTPRRRVLLLVFTVAVVLVYFAEDRFLERIQVSSATLRNENVTWQDERTLLNLDELENPFAASRPMCDERKLDLLILVTSAPAHYYRREAIRDTWGSPFAAEKIASKVRALSDDPRPSSGNLTWKTVFLLGQAATPTLRTLVDMEGEKYGDVLVGNYVDTYRNLTRKVIHGFKFAAEECPSSFVLKTDDDCFVNVAVIVEFLVRGVKKRSNLYLGRMLRDYHVVRNQKSKWFVSTDDYPSPTFPPYVSGSGYVVSGDVPSKFVRKCVQVPVFPAEDAYVGVVLRSLGIVPVRSARFALHSEWKPCNFLYIVLMHGVPQVEQDTLLAKAYQAREECHFTGTVEEEGIER